MPQVSMVFCWSIKCMATKLDECTFRLRHYKRLRCEEIILNCSFNRKSLEPHDGPHQARTAAAHSPFYTPKPLFPYSLHLGILHKLVRICRRVIHAFTYRQREHSSNLIHSGSSCNMGAAEQVVLWCRSLVSRQMLWGGLNQNQNDQLALLPNLNVHIVCFTQGMCWCAFKVLHKGRRHFEKKSCKQHLPSQLGY